MGWRSLGCRGREVGILGILRAWAWAWALIRGVFQTLYPRGEGNPTAI